MAVNLAESPTMQAAARDAFGPAWIAEPGQYDLTDEEYHRDPVVGGSLSSTGARAILPPATPAQFRYAQLHGRGDTKAFDFGRAAHLETLGAGAGTVVVTGSGKDPNAWATDKTKAEVAEARAAGLTPIKPRDADVITAMADRLREHPVAGPLLARAGHAEQSFVARDPETGVMCRVRADWLPTVAPGARQLVVDYKTTRCAEPGAFAKLMGEHGYHQQGAWYMDVLTWLGLAPHGAHFVLVAQEKDPPYDVIVASPNAAAIEWGRIRNRKALDIYRRCVATDTWPGYPTEPIELALPAWLERQYEDAHERGEYDTAADLIGDTAA